HCGRDRLDFRTQRRPHLRCSKGALLTMTTTATRGYCGRLSQLWILLGFLLMALPSSAKTFRVYVTNHAGDTVDVIDPATNKIVQVIEGVEAPHDVSFSPDGSRVYLSIESENVLDVVDRET